MSGDEHVPEGVETDITVSGKAGQFAGANDVVEFWNNLREGVEPATFFTDERLSAAGVDPGVCLADMRLEPAHGNLVHGHVRVILVNLCLLA